MIADFASLEAAVADAEAALAAVRAERECTQRALADAIAADARAGSAQYEAHITLCAAQHRLLAAQRVERAVALGAWELPTEPGNPRAFILGSPAPGWVTILAPSGHVEDRSIYPRASTPRAWTVLFKEYRKLLRAKDPRAVVVPKEAL